ncbi:MAG: hypothetical protein LBV02_06455 [Bacteroidales bacterium]|nr:hypothetical protein [Bacteroidales bacterium]
MGKKRFTESSFSVDCDFEEKINQQKNADKKVKFVAIKDEIIAIWR